MDDFREAAVGVADEDTPVAPPEPSGEPPSEPAAVPEPQEPADTSDTADAPEGDGKPKVSVMAVLSALGAAAGKTGAFLGRTGRFIKRTCIATLPFWRWLGAFIKRTTDQATVSGLALTLFAITAIVALLLSVAYRFTAPLIAEREAAALSAAMSTVLVAEEYHELQHGLYAAKTNGQLMGYIAQVAPDGYRGAITMLVAVSTTGTVIDVNLVSHSESPGIGDRVLTETWFLEQFTGRVLPLDYGSIDTVSGATVTSKAIHKGVSQALLQVTDYIAGGGQP